MIHNLVMASNLEQTSINSSNWLICLKVQNIQHTRMQKKIVYLYYCTESLNLTSIFKTQDARISLNSWNTKTQKSCKSFTILKED